jgi:hypothetical protein
MKILKSTGRFFIGIHRFIKRVDSFQLHDWKHIWWLITQMGRAFLKGDLNWLVDSFMWIVVHLSFDSQLELSTPTKDGEG